MEIIQSAFILEYRVAKFAQNSDLNAHERKIPFNYLSVYRSRLAD